MRNRLGAEASGPVPMSERDEEMPVETPPPRGTPLPAKFTFVIQFGADAETSPQLTGRIEHVISGRQRRFANIEEMVAALAGMIGSAGKTTP